MRWDSNCEVRQMLFEEATIEGQISLLEDFFRGRAPSTLMKRARSLAKIANWLQASDAQGFPISEKLFYEFLRDERSKGAPASRLKAYHEAVVFSRFVLGVSGLERAISSRRCLGAAKSDFPRDRKQAVPLTVEQLKILHAKLQNQGEDVWNRLFAGAVLCVVYARSRWGDAQHACRWALDFDSSGAVAFLEISVANHKSMHAAQHRFQFLPMVSIAVGVVPTEWVTVWLQVRDQLGIREPPSHCLMPAPDQEGGPLARPLTSSEAGKWVRRLLGCDPPPESASRVTSHSFKATLLSMAAKRGYPLEDRLQMGYHSVPGRMALVYSRDGAARSLRLLESMLDEIRKGFFFPDCTRSGRLHGPAKEFLNGWPSEGAAAVSAHPLGEPALAPQGDAKSEIGTDLCLEPIPVLTSDAEEEAESSRRAEDSGHVTTDSSDSDSSALEVPQVRRLTVPTAPQGFRFLQHRKTRMLHLMKDGNERVLECGRMVGPTHVNPQSVRFDSSVCSQCRKATGEAVRRAADSARWAVGGSEVWMPEKGHPQPRGGPLSTRTCCWIRRFRGVGRAVRWDAASFFRLVSPSGERIACQPWTSDCGWVVSGRV